MGLLKDEILRAQTQKGICPVIILIGFILTIVEKTLLYINNLRPGFEPGSPALRAGTITTKPPRRSTVPS